MSVCSRHSVLLCDCIDATSEVSAAFLKHPVPQDYRSEGLIRENRKASTVLRRHITLTSLFRQNPAPWLRMDESRVMEIWKLINRLSHFTCEVPITRSYYDLTAVRHLGVLVGGCGRSGS
jgi:hypothetical protein